MADGAHAPDDRRELVDADLVIAADGGADWLEAIGVAPARLVGDLDSTGPDMVSRLAAAGARLERHSADKDASDLELSVSAAVAAGADEIVLLGALGGRLDHELANVLLLGSEAGDGRRLRLVHGRTAARLMVGPAEAVLTGPIGSLVSLLAIGDAADGVSSQGLRWALNSDRLVAGSSRGLSNMIETTPALVRLVAGRLVVIEIGDSAGGVA